MAESPHNVYSALTPYQSLVAQRAQEAGEALLISMDELNHLSGPVLRHVMGVQDAELILEAAGVLLDCGGGAERLVLELQTIGEQRGLLTKDDPRWSLIEMIKGRNRRER